MIDMTLERNDQLDLNPPYQRKSVWTPKDRRFFLDTIFRNYPTPPIFIHRSLNDEGIPKYHVVDGKQRLETILNFAKSKIALDPSFGDINLDGKKFNGLLPDYKRKFWDYTLIVDFIETIHGTNIEEVFDRVNRNSKNLQAQELRHAIFNGWFITEAENENDEDLWWDIRVNSPAKDKRMKSVQLISELLLIILEKKIVGFSQDYLDSMYAKYDEPAEIDSEDGEFDEDQYKKKKKFVKEYLKQMEEKKACLSIYGKTANNLYIIWALIVLQNQESLPPPEIMAEKYTSFMQEVKKLVDTEDVDALMAADTSNLLQHYYNYFKNSKGASTDLPQRIARFDSLKSAILV